MDQVTQMGPGLNNASAFLLAMRADARDPSMAGFYIPPQILQGDEFETAATMFVSRYGHAVRYLVQIDLNPFGTEAMDQVGKIMDAARSAQPTRALGASISITGLPAVNENVRDYYDHDVMFIIITTILVVLLILIVLLRAIVAPLYLIGSVMISYLSALEIGVIFF